MILNKGMTSVGRSSLCFLFGWLTELGLAAALNADRMISNDNQVSVSETY